MLHWDIDNKIISVATCRNCGHQVGVEHRLELNNTQFSKARNIGTVIDDDTNNLKVLDLIMGCCPEPDYTFLI